MYRIQITINLNTNDDDEAARVAACFEGMLTDASALISPTKGKVEIITDYEQVS